MTFHRPTDIRIRSVSTAYEHYRYRTPIKFGGVAVDRVTLLNVRCEVETRLGKVAVGHGSMPLASNWAFPSPDMGYEQTLASMVRLAECGAKLANDFTEFGHPIDLGLALEEQFLEASQAVSTELALKQPIPKLAALVTGSAFDAALHDAFGKVHALNCFSTYGPDFLPRDLAAYLGADYAGDRLPNYLTTTASERMPLYHLVGALDPLESAQVLAPVGDGLPETLAEWIPYNGLTHLKIKLNGDDVNWDLERILSVDRITTQVQQQRGIAHWHYSLDFNERCPHVDYLTEMLHKLQERTAQGFQRVQYVEQPTARDLRAYPDNRMHAAARLKPVVIDESLTDLETLLLAKEMGYTGAALKACKGQSQSLLMAAAIQKLGMFLCVQDLTCPGASLIHSASLAAHIRGVAAIEANARQYCPAANAGWEQPFPGIFQVTDGQMDTRCLDGLGLGAVEAVLPIA
jgi:L-alanine-DL-glutamate epimerase-like enolase superfamily enzyme